MSGRFRFRPRVFRLDDDVIPAGALAGLRFHSGLVLLDSAAGEPRRMSLLAFDPLPLPPAPAPGAAMRAWLSQLDSAGGDDVPGPFHGGFVGGLSYDLGVDGERALAVAPEPWQQPATIGGLYVDFLVRDESEGRTWLVLGDDPGDGRAPVDQRRTRIAAELSGASEDPRASTAELVADAPRRSVSAHEHCRRIERTRAYIAAGDIYQANLAHRFTCPASGDPIDWYQRLRSVNPAPYMGFARWDAGGGGALLSASPELLFEYDGQRARSRPIKGTAPRSSDPERDRELARGLLASEKDLAELVMIVDLERNDLGRIARPGRVWVEGHPRLESYARVHHLMGDVVCEPRADVDGIDILAALFPGGSVTGAPKLRAMEIIAELEGEGRGFFTGSLGFVDTRGHAAFNILIRTLLWRPPGEFSFRVGGGITWSSDAGREDAETLDKAAGLIAALAGGAA